MRLLHSHTFAIAAGLASLIVGVGTAAGVDAGIFYGGLLAAAAVFAAAELTPGGSPGRKP